MKPIFRLFVLLPLSYSIMIIFIEVKEQLRHALLKLKVHIMGNSPQLQNHIESHTSMKKIKIYTRKVEFRGE